MKGRITDVKEKVIVFGIITGIFLPIRMLFYNYLSIHWIGSLGLVSSLMFVLIFLSHKKKLGHFGDLFLNQITKTVRGKSGKIAIVLSILMIAYFGSTLILIERGNTVYSDEKHLVTQMLFSNYDYNQIDVSIVHKAIRNTSENNLIGTSKLVYVDQIMSMTYAIMNDMMGGWMVNLDLILLVEQLEFLGFLVIYRKIYSQEKPLTIK